MEVGEAGGTFRQVSPARQPPPQMESDRDRLGRCSLPVTQKSLPPSAADPLGHPRVSPRLSGCSCFVSPKSLQSVYRPSQVVLSPRTEDAGIPGPGLVVSCCPPANVAGFLVQHTATSRAALSFPDCGSGAPVPGGHPVLLLRMDRLV